MTEPTNNGMEQPQSQPDSGAGSTGGPAMTRPQPSVRDLHDAGGVADVTFDAANQSLADALRAGFGVLKAIMIVLVILFAFSGMECVEEHQQAAVLRFGNLRPDARGAGLSWALPYPIDQTLRVGVTAERVTIDSHWLNLSEDEKAKPLNQIRRPGQGLNPARDGALLTGDKGLAHVQWSVVYRIDDLISFVKNVADANDERSLELIRTLLQNAALRIASSYTALEVTQSKTDEFAREVKRLLNEELEKLDTGIVVTSVEMPRTTVPVETRAAFVNVVAAESTKEAAIQDARKKAQNLLNETAGGAHGRIIAALDRLEELQQARSAAAGADAVANADPDKPSIDEQIVATQAEIDRMLRDELAGSAGAELRAARAQYTETVQGLQSDRDQFQALLAEFDRNPESLIERLWEQTKERVLKNEAVDKYFLPSTQKEIRIKIGPDPDAVRKREIERLRKSRGEYSPQDEMEAWGDFEVIMPEDLRVK